MRNGTEIIKDVMSSRTHSPPHPAASPPYTEARECAPARARTQHSPLRWIATTYGDLEGGPQGLVTSSSDGHLAKAPFPILATDASMYVQRFYVREFHMFILADSGVCNRM